MRITFTSLIRPLAMSILACACCTSASVPSAAHAPAPIATLPQTTGAPVIPPRESVELSLASSAPVQAFGISIALVGRTHKQFKDPALGVVGVWNFHVEKIGSTAPGLDQSVSGASLHLEGAGLGATWIIEGDYDAEHVTVLRGESAALDRDAAMKLAEEATHHVGEDGSRSSSVEGGVLNATLEDGSRRTRVRVGLYSHKILSIEEVGP